MLGQALLAIACVTLLHAAFSTYEHLSNLKSIGRPEGVLPTDIVLEAFISLILGIFGASLNAPTLKEITWASEMKKSCIDEMDSRLGFADYVNRGKGLFGSG